MFSPQIVLRREAPFENKPLALGTLTKEQLNAALEKGMADIRERRTYSLQSVIDELQRDYGVYIKK